jgi:hypothetical protein
LGVAGRLVRHSLFLFTSILPFGVNPRSGYWFEAPRILTTF